VLPSPQRSTVTEASEMRIAGVKFVSLFK
jgi:hypothetical protein